MIKKIHILISLLILSLLLSPTISAATSDFEEVKYQMTRAIEFVLGALSPFFEYIIGEYNTSDFFFSKILLFILLVVICKNVLDRTPLVEHNKKISLVISIIVSIIAIRFINENNFFEAIFIQYGALGIAITTILPMVIFFYFIHNTKIGTYGRKIFWTLYGITLGAIWILKSSEIPEVANWIYGLTLLAAIIFIFFDKSIHSYFGLSDFKKYEKDSNKKKIWELKKQLDELNEHFQKKRINYSEYKQEKENLENIIKYLSEE